MLSEEKLPFPLCPETGSIWNMSNNKKTTRDQRRGAKDGKRAQQKNHNQAVTTDISLRM